MKKLFLFSLISVLSLTTTLAQVVEITSDTTKLATKAGRFREAYQQGVRYAKGASGTTEITGTRVFRSIAELRRFTSPVAGIQYYLSEKGKEGYWYYDAVDQSSVDNTGTVLITLNGKRLKRIFSEAVNVKWFNAQGTGVGDDTTPIMQAMATQKDVFLPEGRYKLSAALSLHDNQRLYGIGWNSVLSLTVDNLTAIQAIQKTSLKIENLKIEGNDKKNTFGIRLTSCSFATISNVWVTRMGEKKAISPLEDMKTGGFGILVDVKEYPSHTVTIDRCRVDYIAGGGNYRGDGIHIADYDTKEPTIYNVTVSNCSVSTVARHCYAVGGEDSKKAYEVHLLNCYGERSALDWLDVEDAASVRVTNGIAKRCGNDQTYYNPVLEYGADYNLLAAIAVGNVSGNVEVNGFVADSCYAAFSLGGADYVYFQGMQASNSAYADYIYKLANCPKSFVVRDSKFLTPNKSTVWYYNGSGVDAKKKFSNIVFSSPVRLGAANNVNFDGCEFRQGLIFNSGDIQNVTISNSDFKDFSGDAISWSGDGLQSNQITIANNRFTGGSGMTHGIAGRYRSLFNVTITGNVFTKIPTGISHVNMNNDSLVFNITGNTFRQVGNGIDLHQATKRMLISRNTFENVTGWAISQSDIFDGTDHTDNTISENIIGGGVANGIRISNVNGRVDHNIITNNNVRRATNAKLVIDQNPAGIIVNNQQ